jgi:integrase
MAVFYPNNRIKPHAVMTPDGEQTIKDGYYVLYYARKWEPVGNDPNEAQRLLLRKRGELQTMVNGGTVLQPTTVSGSLYSALESWIQDFVDGGAHPDTILVKRMVAREFQQSCKVRTLAAVTRSMCLNYINAWTKKRGNADRTRFNKFLQLRQFLKFHNLTELLTTKDAPKYAEEDPIILENDDLSLFWKVCPGHKRLMFVLLLESGMRKAEIRTLRWVDLIGGSEPHIKIQPRPEWNYMPKRHHCRNIPVANPETWALLMRQKMRSKSPLVFTTKNGQPLTHLWEDTQRLTRRAGIDVAKGHPHAWRATYCTTLHRQGVPVTDIMKLMGHSDIQSTMRYLAPLRGKDLHAKMATVKFAVA